MPVESQPEQAGDLLVTLGGALKALGGGRVGGLLVPFGDEATADLDGEYFTKATDFDRDLPGSISTYYNHGLDPTLGKRRLGRGTVKMDDAGVWFETQLDLADAYQARIHRLVQAGKLGMSSGSAAHLVERRTAGKSVEITRWPLVEASFTTTPANPSARTFALKTCEMAPTFDALEAALKAERPPLADHAQYIAARVEELWDYVERLDARSEFRVKAGRMLSGANCEEMHAIAQRIYALLAKAGWSPTGDASAGEDEPAVGSAAGEGVSPETTRSGSGDADGGMTALRELARYEAFTARLGGAPVSY